MRFARLTQTLAALALLCSAASGLELEIEARDSNGAPVQGLTSEDILFEFGGKATPLDALRYVDGLAETKIYVGAEMPAVELAQIKGAIVKMIDELPDGVEVSLGGAPFTADKQVLRGYLELGVELAKKAPAAGFVKIWDFGQAYRVQGKPILDNYALLASQLSRVPGQKKVVIYRPALELRQDGLDTREMNIRTGQLRQNDADMLRNEDEIDRLGTVAAFSRVRFYPTNAPSAEGSLDDQGLTAVARHTGGKPALGGANPHDVLRIALEDVPSYYVAKLSPPLEGKGGRRSLKASLEGKGAEAKLARGYVIDLPGLASLSVQAPDLLSKDAVDSTLPIQAQHWVFRGADGKPLVLVCAGTPAVGLQTSEADKGLAVELGLAAGHKAGSDWTTTARRLNRRVFDKKAFASAQKRGDVTIDVAAAGTLPGPGMFPWKTVLANQANGAVGVYEGQVGAHDLARPLATSDLLLTRLAVPVEPNTPAEPWGELLDFGGSRLVPESTREFQIGEPVLFSYRLYNAPREMLESLAEVQLALFKDDVQLESFDGQGQSQVIAEGAEIQYVGSIQTKGLAPGRYVLLSAVPGREDERHPYVEGGFTLVK